MRHAWDARLEAVGEHAAPRASRLVELVLLVAHAVVHAARGGHVADQRIIHERRAYRRHLALDDLRELVEDELGRDELEHRIPQVLEPLVIVEHPVAIGLRRHAALLLHKVRWVHERLAQSAR